MIVGPFMLAELLAVGIFLAVAMIALGRLNRPSARIAERAVAVTRPLVLGPQDASAQDGELTVATWDQRLLNHLAVLGNRLPLFSAKQRRIIANHLATAGFRQVRALQVFIGVKLAMGGILAMAGAFATRFLGPDTPTVVHVILVLGGLQTGLILPEAALKRRVSNRRKAIHQALPDTLDLMVICTNAGYSLSMTIRRIAAEMRLVCPAMANELEITAHDIHLHADPVVGLRNLAERTGVESLRAMVATLVQAHRYGTPITQSLKTLARTERTTRLLALEERGAKLAAKITMPMMLFILPAVIMLAGGPAFMRLTEAFAK